MLVLSPLGDLAEDILNDSMSWFCNYRLRRVIYFLKLTCSSIKSMLSAIGTWIASMLPEEFQNNGAVITDVFSDLKPVAFRDLYFIILYTFAFF
jgi:hypothetical protein